MSKHPGPWTLDPDTNQLSDAGGIVICMDVTDDPETRAVLLHAAEMWNTIKLMAESNGTYDVRWALAIDMERMIEAEIAKGKP